MASLGDYMGRAESRTTAGLIAYVIERSPIMQFLQLQHFSGLSHTFAVQGQLPAGSFREMDAAFQTVETKAPETYTQQMKDFGGTRIVDYMIEENETKYGNNYKADVLMDMTRSYMLDAKANIFGKGLQSNGVYGLIDWNEEYAPQQNNETLIAIGANGRQINDGTDANADAQLIDSLLFQLKLAVRPDFYVTNRNIMAQIRAVAAGANNSTLGNKIGTASRVVQDPSGMMPAINVNYITYDGIPMLDIGEDSQDNPIFAFNETQGSNDFTSRIMAVKNGIDGAVVLHKHPSFFDIAEYMQDDNKRLRVSLPHLVEVRQKSSVGSIVGILTA